MKIKEYNNGYQDLTFIKEFEISKHTSLRVVIDKLRPYNEWYYLIDTEYSKTRADWCLPKDVFEVVLKSHGIIFDNNWLKEKQNEFMKWKMELLENKK